MGVNPTDIVQHKFSRSFLGGLDAEEVRGFLADVATALNRALTELTDARARCASLEQELRDARAGNEGRADDLEVKERVVAQAETRLADVERSLRDLAAKYEEVTKALAAETTARRQAEAALAELRGELAASRQRLTVFEERDSQVAGVLLNTQKIVDQMVRSAQEDSGKLLAAAVAEKERLAAESRAEAERAVKEAQAAAERIIAKAQSDAERLVADASTVAGRLTADAEAASLRARTEAQAHVTELAGRVTRLLDLNTAFGRALDAVRARHGELLTALAGAHADVDERVLPLLENWQRILKSAPVQAPATEARSGRASAPDAVPSADRPPHEEAAVPAPGDVRGEHDGQGRHREEAVTTPVQAGTATQADGEAEGDHTEEIVISPLATFFEAAEFLIELSRLPGVRMAHIRTLSQGVATFDAVVEGDARLDVSRLGGHPIQIVERGEARLVLRRLSAAGH